jgi:hypothetical protein
VTIINAMNQLAPRTSWIIAALRVGAIGSIRSRPRGVARGTRGVPISASFFLNNFTGSMERGPSARLFRGALLTAKQLSDLLVGLLAEQPDDDGAEVLVARPPHPLSSARPWRGAAAT